MKSSKALKQFNNFVIRTGIREYCSTICKGDCCRTDDCYSKLNNDFKYCHQHLACTYYYCYDIGNIIHFIDQYKEQDLQRLKDGIYEKLHTNIYDYQNKNIFFTPYSLLDYEITSYHFPRFDEEFYIKMSKLMKKAIKLKLNRHDLYKLRRVNT